MGQWYCKSGIKQTKNSIKNILHYIHRKRISDNYIRELIDFLEEEIKSYDPKSKLSEARKILKVDFKEKLDESLKIKLGKSELS